VSLADVDELMLGDSTIAGDLSVTAGGEISDASTISVAGDATLVAGTFALPYDITLDSTTSTYRGSLSLQGNNVSVTNNYATVLGDSSATGNLTVTTTGSGSTLTNLLNPGPPTVNGILSVVGNTTLNAGSNALTLYEAGCTFTGGVFLTGSPVSVIPANHAPVLAGIEGTALAYTKSDPATVITASIMVADPGSPLLAGATIRITGNYQNGADVLSFTNTGAITGTWNAAAGTLTLSGADTVANYEAALRAVKFFSSSEGTNDRTVTFTVNDGASNSNSVTRDITVNP